MCTSQGNVFISDEERLAQRQAQYAQDVAAVQQQCLNFGYKKSDQLFPFCVQTQYDALLALLMSWTSTPSLKQQGMTNVSQIRREEMYARNAEYKQHRMALPISDEQYLFWDDVLTNHFDKAFELYERLLAKTFVHCRTGCFDTGRKTRMKLKWGYKWLFAHRFTYAVGVSLPLSSQQIVRHQCANFRCLNPAHIELGDQAQNFIDLKAAQAYGIRWELLPKAPLETIR